MSTVTEADKKLAVSDRLEALENDDNAGETLAAGSDDEFQLEDSEDGEPRTVSWAAVQ